MKSRRFHPLRWGLLLPVLLASFAQPDAQAVTPAGAVRPGFTANALEKCDDCSSGSTPLGFTLNFFGKQYSNVYVNNNGNLTFEGATAEYESAPLNQTDTAIIAPFWADVDTRTTGSNPAAFSYGATQVDGHNAFGATWSDVGYYGQTGKIAGKKNTFQAVLIDRSDVAPGDFDIEFNYDKVQWETGSDNGGTDGLGGSSARVGWSNGTGASFELPGSAVNGAFLDTNATSGLKLFERESGVAGRYRFEIRNAGGGSGGGGVTDSVAPKSFAKVSPTPNGAGWNSSDVAVSLKSIDSGSGPFGSYGSGMKAITYGVTHALNASATPTDLAPEGTVYSGPIPVSDEGITTITYHAIDNQDNIEATKTVTVRMDKQKPVVTFNPASPAANANGWNTTDVSIPFTATDPAAPNGAEGSGLTSSAPNPADGPLQFTGQGAGLTRTVVVKDAAGNFETYTSPGVNIDRTFPTVTIYSLGGTYVRGRRVLANYTCTDSISGIRAENGCAGPVPNGAEVDTLTLGFNTFIVNGYDKAGLYTGAPVSYRVVAGTNNAEFVSQDVPTQMAVGQKYVVSVKMRNTGTSYWRRELGFYLSSQNPVANKTWGHNLISIPAGVVVAPGEEFTFRFTPVVPATPGKYNFQWRVAQYGVNWFGQTTPNVEVDVTANDAEFVSQTAPPSNMSPGQTAVVSVTMKNTGLTTWTKDAGFVLSAQNPVGNKTWGTNLRYLPAGTSVAPGQTYTFTFVAKAPMAGGTYPFQWRMAQTGVNWFGQTSANVEVSVPYPLTWYEDADGDGYGNYFVTTSGYVAPAGFVSNSDDCNDGDAGRNPGASEIPGDGKDNDCDGEVDNSY